ncbi:Rpp14/Pop5 family protein [Candidatus Altiarchaeota archaeon]
MKPLPPTLRERNRYLSFKVEGGKPFKDEDVGKAVWFNCLRILGEAGLSGTGLRVIEFDAKKQMGILKVNHKSVDKTRASLALIKEVDREPAAFHTIRVSGTVKKARESK